MRGEDFFNQLEDELPTPTHVAAEVDTPFILAANVYSLRQERGLTQSELARRIGVAQPRIAEIERGDANPRLDTLARLALALDVPVSALLVQHQAETRWPEAVPAGAQLNWTRALDSLGESSSCSPAERSEAEPIAKRAGKAVGSVVRLERGRRVRQGHVYEMTVFESTYAQRVR